MAVEGLARGGGGIAFLVSTGVVYEIIAASCSSPQTTEINAKTRSGTLMKWVHVGLAQAGLFVVVAASLEPENAGPILAGGALAAGLLYFQYVYANQAGLASSAPGTES